MDYLRLPNYPWTPNPNYTWANGPLFHNPYPWHSVRAFAIGAAYRVLGWPCASSPSAPAAAFGDGEINIARPKSETIRIQEIKGRFARFESWASRVCLNHYDTRVSLQIGHTSALWTLSYSSRKNTVLVIWAKKTQLSRCHLVCRLTYFIFNLHIKRCLNICMLE
jgi:hypothetical protein